MAPIRVVLADDSLIIRAGLVALLADEDGIDVVAEAGSLSELLAAVATHDPDVVVTDIRMPPTSTDEGLQAARQLRVDRPAVAVVVMSQYAEAVYALELMESGSRRRGYMLKDRLSHPGQLVEVIRDVWAGGSFVDPMVVDALVSARVRDGRRNPLGALTEREREVLSEVATGRSNAAIASRLFVSERAVEKHINSILSKLGLGDDAETHRRVTAVLMWLENG